MAVSDLLPVAVLVVDPKGDLGENLESAADTEEDRIDLSAVGDPEVALNRITNREKSDPARWTANGEVIENIDCVLADARATDAETLDRLEAAMGPRPVLVVTDGRTETVCRAYEAGVDETIPAAPVSEAPGRIVDRIVECVSSALDRHRTNIIDGLAVPVTVHDPASGELVDANQAAADLLGYDRDALIGAGVDGVTASDVDGEASNSPEAVRESLREFPPGDPSTFEWHVETAGGEHRSLAVTATRVDRPGKPRVMATARDVTERKELERTYRGVFESVGDGLVVHDPETGEILDVNERFCRMNGYDRDELVGETVDLITAADEEYSYEEAADLIDRARREGAQLFEWRNERANGQTFPVEVHLNVAEIRGEERVLASVRDITERKRRRREFEEIFHGVEDPITIHDPETAELLELNDGFCELLGYSREEILEMGIEGYSPQEEGFSMEAAREFVHEVVESDDPKATEWVVETADGERRYLESKGTVAEVGGETRYVAINRDVTERRRRQREFEQIFNGVIDPIAVYDPETLEILDANDAFLDLVDREDLASIRDRGIEEFMVTEEGFTVERAREIHQRIVGTGEPETFDWKGRTDDGDHLWLEVKVTPAVIGGDTVTVASHRDITERRRRQREYEQIFNGVNDAIGVFDPETYEMVAVNDRMCELTGYDRETILEQRELVSATDEGYNMERAAELIDQVVSEPGPHEWEWRLETSDGQRRTLEARGTTVRIGGEDRVVVISRDVTERRRTERQLRTIAERVDEVIYVGSPDLQKVYYLSPSYEEIWDQPVERMYDDAQAFLERIHPDDEEWYGELVEEIRRDLTDPGREPQDTYQYQYRVVHDDGEVRWVETRGYPVYDDAGALDRFITVNRDVTERKERRQTLESFQEATTELTTAETPADACRTAVATAAEVFDLSRVAVHLYDEETGDLEPAAATDPLAPVGDLPTWSATEGIQWDVFVDGTMDSADVVETPSLSIGAGESALLVALSGHGLITVWADDTEAITDAVETANILAATLEGALNHLAGERRLKSHRERLREETERAERLERIAELTRRVEAAITGQSDRMGIERAVCERLTDIEPFTAAWVAAPDVGTDRLQPQTVVGLPNDHAERALSTTPGEAGGPRGRHPAYEALESGVVSVETGLVGTATGGEWRETLLRNGAQAVCAVPLTYEGIAHGVVTVVAEESGAFDDRERETLDQLGASIGYAITAVERRRALESDATVELEFRGDGSSLPFARLAAATDCQVRHGRTVRRRDGSIRIVYSVFGHLPEDLEAVAGEALPGEVEVGSRREGEAVVERTGTDWFGEVASEYGGVLRQGRASPEEATLVVELPTEADTRRFVDRLEERIPEVELVAQRQHQASESTPSEVGAKLEARLTDRQHEAIATALEMGYFEWPREASGQEVADRMDITQPTLNKHLRVAEREAVELVVG